MARRGSEAAFRNDLRLLRDRLISNLSVGVVSFPDFGEFEEDTVRREHRDNQSRNAVAQATVSHVAVMFSSSLRMIMDAEIFKVA
jgi:hypothetical protein